MPPAVAAREAVLGRGVDLCCRHREASPRIPAMLGDVPMDIPKDVPRAPVDHLTTRG